MLLVGLLAAYPQTQTMQPTDEKKERDAKDGIEVANGGPALEKQLEDYKCLLLGEKRKKPKRNRKASSILRKLFKFEGKGSLSQETEHKIIAPEKKKKRGKE